MTLNIMCDLHNVIDLSIDVSHVLVLSYYLVNNKICLKKKNFWKGPKTTLFYKFNVC